MDPTRQVVQIKIESVYGQDALPGVTDAILVESFSATRDNLKMAERNPIEASKALRQKSYAGSLYSITYDVEVKGDTAAGLPPEAGVSLQAAGMSQSIIANTSVTYQPMDTGQGSVTIYRYVDGKRQRFVGCRGSHELKINVHEKLVMSFTLIGKMLGYDDAGIAGATYSSVVPVPVVSANFIVDSYSAVISSLSVSMTNEVKPAVNMNAADGFGEITLGKRRVSGSFDPEEVLNSVYDFKAKMEANATFAIGVGTLGGLAGNRFSMSMTKAHFVDDGIGERENKVTRQMQFESSVSNVLDDLIYVFS